jgi:hypothetical protein
MKSSSSWSLVHPTAENVRCQELASLEAAPRCRVLYGRNSLPAVPGTLGRFFDFRIGMLYYKPALFISPRALRISLDLRCFF